MNHLRRLSCVTVAALLATALLTSPRALHAEKPDVVPAPAKKVVVVNDDTDPVPIEGAVDATIQGTVPVLVENPDPIAIEGSVLVDNPDPISIEGAVDATVQNTVEVGGTVEVQDFNLQLDDLKFEVQQVREAVEDLQQAARTPWTYHKWEGVNNGDVKCVPAPGGGWQDTELIVLSPENDSMNFSIYASTDCSPVNNEMLSIGPLNAQFPTVQPVVLPVPLTIGSYRINCANSLEDCEVHVNFSGTTPAP